MTGKDCAENRLDHKLCVGDRVMFNKVAQGNPVPQNSLVGWIVEVLPDNKYKIHHESYGDFIIHYNDILGKIFNVMMLVKKDGTKEYFSDI